MGLDIRHNTSFKNEMKWLKSSFKMKWSKPRSNDFQKNTCMLKIKVYIQKYY